MATTYPLKKINTEDYVAWIRRLYNKDKRKINKRYIKNVVSAVKTPHVYPGVLFLFMDAPNISIEDIDRVESNILENRKRNS